VPQRDINSYSGRWPTADELYTIQFHADGERFVSVAKAAESDYQGHGLSDLNDSFDGVTVDRIGVYINVGDPTTLITY
jgi:hypothetical protein